MSLLGKILVFETSEGEITGVILDKYSKGMLSSDNVGWATDVYIVQDLDSNKIHHINCTKLISNGLA